MFFFIAFNIILLLMMVLIYLVTKKIFNPVIIINSIFLVWLIIGRSGFAGLYTPSFDSSLFIQINILIIDIGVIIGLGMHMQTFTFPMLPFNSERIFFWLRRVALGISLLCFANLMINIITGRLLISNVRNISYSVAFGTMDYAQIYLNSVIYYVYQYLVRGFAFFDLSYGIAKLLVKKEKISFIAVSNYVLFIIIMQSRIEFMKMVLFILIFVLFHKIKLSKEQKKIIKKVVLIVGIAVLIIFSFRSSKSEQGVIKHTVDSFIIDFSGSNFTFSTFFDQYNQGDNLNDSPLILKYLGGVGLLIEFILRPIGVKFDHSSVNNYLGVGHNIGSSNHYNAFYTIYFEFLNSGGYLGCFIFSILIGIIIGYTYKKMRNQPTVKNIYIASFCTYIMAMGTYNYVISGIYALMIICCIYLSGDCKNENKKYK